MDCQWIIYRVKINKEVMKKRYFIILIFIVLISACNSNRLIIEQDIPRELGIHLINEGEIDNADFQIYVDATNQFIEEHNKMRNYLNLYYSDVDSNSLNVYIVKNSYVTESQQAIGIAITALGVGVLAATLLSDTGFWLVFWYSPVNKAVLGAEFSDDIDSLQKSFTVKTIQTRHRFENLKDQKEKQKKAYSNFLYQTIFNIEANMAKH